MAASGWGRRRSAALAAVAVLAVAAVVGLVLVLTGGQQDLDPTSASAGSSASPTTEVATTAEPTAAATPPATAPTTGPTAPPPPATVTVTAAPRPPRTTYVVPPGPDPVFFTAIVASRSSRSAAERYVPRIEAAGYTASVFSSDDYSSLNAGYWVAAAGSYATFAEADAAARALRATFPDAYPRCVGSAASCSGD